MKYVKWLGLSVLSLLALSGLGAASASATTLEVGGAAKNESVAVTASLVPGTSLIMSTTSGEFATTCTTSHMQGATASPFTGATVSTPLTALTLAGCTKAATVHKPGKIEIAWSSGTNGTVFIEGSQVTLTYSGFTVNCTSSKTHYGTLTGVASGHATMDINAVFNCGFILPSLTVKAAYIVTSPTGLGVTA